MENINIGIANLIISEKLKKSYFNDNLLKESKDIINDFFLTIKNSPLLQLEFKVLNNIENKHIANDVVAGKYIDNSIKLFETYTIDEINNEHLKLLKYIDNVNVDKNNDKYKLYESVNNLILESLKTYDNINVDLIHESFSFILNYLKTEKEENMNCVINEDVIKIAVDKFNDKYDILNEDERILIQKLIKCNYDDKVSLYEEYKQSTLETLKQLKEQKKDNTVIEGINKAISKINEFKYTEEDIDDKIIDLYTFKKDLI